MRKLDRSNIPVPPSLNTPGSPASAEMTNAVAYYNARSPWTPKDVAFPFCHYRGRDVKAALRLLAGGNCAYCESKINASGAREVEHYRPKGGIDNAIGHPGYWWLANDWDNFLPTCRDCNKSLKQHIVTPNMTRPEVEDLLSKTPASTHGKGIQFNIRGTRAVTSVCALLLEDPLLIDPCRRDPANDLRWDFTGELTLIEPKSGAAGPSPYGEYTINTCALNRAELVLDRIPALRQMRLLRTHILNRLTLWNGSADELAIILAETQILNSYTEPDQPFAGMAKAYVNDFMEELDGWRMARGLPSF